MINQSQTIPIASPSDDGSALGGVEGANVLEASGVSGRPRQRDEMYGITRRMCGKNAELWVVGICRRDRLIQRSFYDGVYGSRDESLAMARAYRDAVIDLFPPMTNREKASRVQERNQSGTPGVYRVMRWGKIRSWQVMITTKDGHKRAWFDVGDYGEDKARALAVAQREAWWQEAQIAFCVDADMAKSRAAVAFDELLKDPDGHAEAGTIAALMAEGEERLAEINADFDRMRPVWLNLRLAVRGPKRDRLVLRIGCTGQEVDWTTASFNFQSDEKSLATALDRARNRAAELIAKMFSAETSDWFLIHHGFAFSTETFDTATGLSVRDRVLMASWCCRPGGA